jgi:catechol 2,3-dioxygenase-like lactoylglutathione lyase family enzyme
MPRIVHIAIKVDNLEKATMFYEEVFGFRQTSTLRSGRCSPPKTSRQGGGDRRISDDLARPNLKERDEWPPRISCRPASVIRIVQ